MFYRVLIAAMLCFSGIYLNAQRNIIGEIKLDSGAPFQIENYPIFLHSPSGYKDTTYTDAEGVFQFEITPDTSELYIIKTLGYCNGWTLYTDTANFNGTNLYHSLLEICHEDENIDCSAQFNLVRIDSTSFRFEPKTIFDGLIRYEWNFGDGVKNYTASPLHSYVQRGIYEVSLILKTPFGCTDTTEMEVLASDDSYVRGSISIDNYFLSDAYIWLIGFDYDQNTIIKIIYPDDNGKYGFWCEPNFGYLLKVIPDFDENNYSPRILPTYYKDAISWRNASVFEIQHEIRDLNITALTSDFIPHGFNTINGNLIFSKDIDQAPVNVFLLNKNMEAIDFATVTNGTFDFENLPADIYYILPEYVGKVSNPVKVIFNEDFDDPVSTQFIVTTTHINPIGINDTEYRTNFVDIYPVPVKNQITVNAKLPVEKINVRDCSGKVIYSLKGKFRAENIFNTSHWQAGVYILEVFFSDHSSENKVVVK